MGAGADLQREVHEHPQVEANGFLPIVHGADGLDFRLVAAPQHFDGESTRPSGPAPELGQHTEEVLIDLGYTWEDIDRLKTAEVI